MLRAHLITESTTGKERFQVCFLRRSLKVAAYRLWHLRFRKYVLQRDVEGGLGCWQTHKYGNGCREIYMNHHTTSTASSFSDPRLRLAAPPGHKKRKRRTHLHLTNQLPRWEMAFAHVSPGHVSMPKSLLNKVTLNKLRPAEITTTEKRNRL